MPFFNSEKKKKTGEANFLRVIIMYKEETSPGGRFNGSLVGAVLLKPFDSSDPV